MARKVPLDSVLETISENLPTGPDKASSLENLTQEITRTAGDEISAATLENPNVQATLALAVVQATILPNKPTLVLDYGTLIKNKNDLEEGETEALKTGLQNMLSAVNQLEPNQNKRESDDTLKDYANNVVDRAQNSNSETLAEDGALVTLIQNVYQNLQNSNTLDQSQQMSLKSLFGGIDPGVTGEIISPVQSVIANAEALIDQGPAFQTTAAIHKGSLVNLQQGDSLGIEANVDRRLNAIGDTTPESNFSKAKGDISEAVADKFPNYQSLHETPTNRPTPTGGK